MAHTLGPWKVDPMGRLVRVEAARHFGICHVLRNTDGPIMSDHLCLANAKLIAAAPVMLAACEAFLADFDEAVPEGAIAADMGGIAPLIDAMRAAVAKAEEE